MLSCHEILGFMPSTLSVEILEATLTADKPTYQALLNTVAETRKVRPAFLLKKPKPERHQNMLATLATPRLEESAAFLLRQWLMKTQLAMLVDFLNRLGIAHSEGVVDQFPANVDAPLLKAAVDDLLARYPQEKVTIYLHSLLGMELVDWPSLISLLQQDSRLQLG